MPSTPNPHLPTTNIKNHHDTLQPHIAQHIRRIRTPIINSANTRPLARHIVDNQIARIHREDHAVDLDRDLRRGGCAGHGVTVHGFVPDGGRGEEGGDVVGNRGWEPVERYAGINHCLEVGWATGRV